jgi:hypothetical protein
LLLNDEGLYNNLESSSKQLELLLEDIRKNPGSYINFSVFGEDEPRVTAQNYNSINIHMRGTIFILAIIFQAGYLVQSNLCIAQHLQTYLKKN